MSDFVKSCTVAPPMQCNRATGEHNNATVHATAMQPSSIKALAAKVLSRNQACNNNATEAETACNYLGAKGSQKLHGLTLVELQEAAGPDWPEVQADTVLLETFAAAVATRRMREAGVIPPHYTSTTICARCGPVLIFPGVPAHVLACPWCFNRAASKPVPKA
jgi:hypothetical protein